MPIKMHTYYFVRLLLWGVEPNRQQLSLFDFAMAVVIPLVHHRVQIPQKWAAATFCLVWNLGCQCDFLCISALHSAFSRPCPTALQKGSFPCYFPSFSGILLLLITRSEACGRTGISLNFMIQLPSQAGPVYLDYNYGSFSASLFSPMTVTLCLVSEILDLARVSCPSSNRS